MTKQQAQEYVRTRDVFLREAKPDQFNNVERMLDRLHRYETTLRRIAENGCNGWDISGRGDEDLFWRERDEKKEAAIEARVQGIADALGFKVRFNGDPRGGAIRFILPSGKSNSLDGETWGIYW